MQLKLQGTDTNHCLAVVLTSASGDVPVFGGCNIRHPTKQVNRRLKGIYYLKAKIAGLEGFRNLSSRRNLWETPKWHSQR